MFDLQFNTDRSGVDVNDLGSICDRTGLDRVVDLGRSCRLARFGSEISAKVFTYKSHPRFSELLSQTFFPSVLLATVSNKM